MSFCSSLANELERTVSKDAEICEGLICLSGSYAARLRNSNHSDRRIFWRCRVISVLKACRDFGGEPLYREALHKVRQTLNEQTARTA